MVPARDLATRFGLEAVPILALFDSLGTPLSGGYYSHPATITPLDERIYVQIRAGSEVEPLPVFGCAITVT